jgi:hypothetical protein
LNECPIRIIIIKTFGKLQNRKTAKIRQKPQAANNLKNAKPLKKSDPFKFCFKITEDERSKESNPTVFFSNKSINQLGVDA